MGSIRSLGSWSSYTKSQPHPGLFSPYRYLKDYDYYQKCLAEQDRESKPTLKRNRNQSKGGNGTGGISSSDSSSGGCLCFTSSSSKSRRSTSGALTTSTTMTTTSEATPERPLFASAVIADVEAEAVWQGPSGISRSIRFILVLPVLLVFICTIFTILILLQIYT